MGTTTAASTDASSANVLNDTTAGGLFKNVPNLYRLVTGQHANTTTLVGFTELPQLAFLQGPHLSFRYQDIFTRYADKTAVTDYPYAAVVVLALQNTTDEDLVHHFVVRGTSSSASYGAGVFMKPETDGTWQPLGQITTVHPNFGIHIECPLAAHQMTTLMIVTTACPDVLDTLCVQTLHLSFTLNELPAGVVITKNPA